VYSICNILYEKLVQWWAESQEKSTAITHSKQSASDIDIVTEQRISHEDGQDIKHLS